MSTLPSYLKNLPGKQLNGKFLVIESDDWGAVRMTNLDTYNSLLSKGIRVDKCIYNRYDQLENADDLSAIADVISGIKDIKGNPVVITANYLMANPNFGKIEETCFQEYCFESFQDSYLRYYPNQRVFELTSELISKKLFMPQLHSREHLNPEIWLSMLRNGNKHLLEAFHHHIFGLSFVTSGLINKPYLASLYYENEEQRTTAIQALKDSARMFKESFGFDSKSFIAPLYRWNTSIEEVMHHIGINYIQGADRQISFNSSNTKRKFHPFGSKNNYGQYYLNRNVNFELTGQNKSDVLNNALKQIEIAFTLRKPAVLCTHRINFMGGLHEKNRTENLFYLESLLARVLKKWPDVQFISSADLGELLKNKYDTVEN